jgi:hypothetical protein
MREDLPHLTHPGNWKLPHRNLSKHDLFASRLLYDGSQFLSFSGRFAIVSNAEASTGITMPEVTIVYWRDIPAQIIVGKGRTGSKVKLTERFEQAIDRCAMKVGLKDADAYLGEWRKAPPFTVEGEPDAVAASEAAKIEATYDTERLKTLINAEGWAKPE